MTTADVWKKMLVVHCVHFSAGGRSDNFFGGLLKEKVLVLILKIWRGKCSPAPKILPALHTFHILLWKLECKNIADIFFAQLRVMSIRPLFVSGFKMAFFQLKKIRQMSYLRWIQFSECRKAFFMENPPSLEILWLIFR